ncbi:MAG: VanZ family protein [Mariprofundaceae bacterium]
MSFNKLPTDCKPLNKDPLASGSKATSWLLLGLYCSLIYWLSDQPAYPTPLKFPGNDKLLHLIAYGIMALIAWHAFSKDHDSGRWFHPISVVLFCMVFGASDEWHQSFIPGRTSDIHDWMADSFGAVFTVNFIIFLKQYRPILIPKRTKRRA